MTWKPLEKVSVPTMILMMQNPEIQVELTFWMSYIEHNEMVKINKLQTCKTKGLGLLEIYQSHKIMWLGPKVLNLFVLGIKKCNDSNIIFF